MAATALFLALALALLPSSLQYQINQEAHTIGQALGGLSSREAFDAWAQHHGKSYATEEEREHRYAVWQSSLATVVARNAQNTQHSLRLGLNAWSDLSREEFRARFLSKAPATQSVVKATEVAKEVSWRYENVRPKKHMDWRDADIMGPVRSQHAFNWSCGSCWAFATVGIAEASSALYSGEVVPGSEQQLIDCDDAHDHGCDGGDFHNGLDYIIYNKGLASEEEYPYIGHDDECDKPAEKKHSVKVDDWESVPKHNETALLQAITMRPVVTAVCCGDNIDDWHHYTGGVFDIPCCVHALELDHAMVVMGYGVTDDDEEYWLLKNSWSEGWGEQGYMKMKRGVGGVGQCGVASMPTMVFRGPKPPPPNHVVASAWYTATTAARRALARLGRALGF